MPQGQSPRRSAQAAHRGREPADGIRQQHDAMLLTLEILLGEPARDGRRLLRAPRFDFVLVQQPKRNRITVIEIHQIFGSEPRALGRGGRAAPYIELPWHSSPNIELPGV